MSFKIYIDGLDDLNKEIKEMQKGISLTKVNELCRKIEEDAKAVCPEECREYIKLQCVTSEVRADIGFTYDTQSKEALIHLREATRKNLPSMTALTQILFEGLLKDIENTIEGS